MKSAVKTSAKTTLGIAACLAVTIAAYAAVFYVDGDTIFVGKGNVQTACGLNNAGAQAFLTSSAAQTAFDVDLGDSYKVTCEFDAGPTHHEITFRRHVTTRVAYNPRNHQQIDGIFLDLSSSGHEVPEVGDECPGNSGLGLVTVVEPIGISGTGAVSVKCPNGNTVSLGTPTPLP